MNTELVFFTTNLPISFLTKVKDYLFSTFTVQATHKIKAIVQHHLEAKLQSYTLWPRDNYSCNIDHTNYTLQPKGNNSNNYMYMRSGQQ